MNWPWRNRKVQPPDPNPNGFYTQWPMVNIHTCHGCTTRAWTFDAMSNLEFISDHLDCPGAITVTPATWEYRAMVQATISEALHTVGGRR